MALHRLDKTYYCDCGTSYEEVKGDLGGAKLIYNGLRGEWVDYCPYCGQPVGMGGELIDESEWPEDVDYE